MAERKWISLYDYYSEGPTLLDRAVVGTAIACKVVAVVGGSGDWAAYRGLADESDEHVARSGDKISQEAAEGLFPTFRDMGFRYRY